MTSSSASWDALLDPALLSTYFAQRISGTRSSGIDRVGADTLEPRLATEIASILSRAAAGSYRFSPYLERLVLKGRAKHPRVISVPTLSNRLLLHLLKLYIHETMPGAVSRLLPNEHIRRLKGFLQTATPADLWVIRSDIRTFYDDIVHPTLFSLISSSITDVRVQTLLRRALRTPTIPTGSRRPTNGHGRNNRGVPQGLAISNSLANAYVHSLDISLRQQASYYLRYVDDILIIAPSTSVAHIKSYLGSGLATFGLEANEEKSHERPLLDGFEYLGYRISWPLVSIRRSTVEKFVKAVAGMITGYKYRVAQKRYPPYMSPALYRQAFLDELNEKITGAISETRRYGWIFYFSEMNDQRLLHQMDATVQKLLATVPEFVASPPQGLKRLARAHFEALHSPNSGYILDYNAIRTVRERFAFLVRRGRLAPTDDARLTPQEIIDVFDQYRLYRLSRLEQDVGVIS